MHNSKTLIIGAGIGGLSAALALLRSGQRVAIYEQAAALGEVGAGLSITPNASNALHSLGLGAELERIGSTPPAGVIRHYATGAVLVTLSQDSTLERYGAKLYHVHRADLHSALAQAVHALDPNALHLSHELESVEFAGSEVSVRFTNGVAASGDWLVGCDGIRSKTRAALFGADTPNFTGFVAWRGLIPGELVDPEMLDPPMCLSVGPRRMLMRYPLRRGAVVNIVAIARRPAWTEEGWSVHSEVSEMLEEFGDFEPRILHMLGRMPPERLFKWGIFDRDPVPHWVRERATLLGDAAHPMPPFAGQGAVMALEDAVVLGRAAASATDPMEAMQRYEAARRPRCVRVLEMSRARANLYFAPDPQSQVRALGEGFIELRTLYDYDAASTPV